MMDKPCALCVLDLLPSIGGENGRISSRTEIDKREGFTFGHCKKDFCLNGAELIEENLKTTFKVTEKTTWKGIENIFS